jgi:hypothetical protein
MIRKREFSGDLCAHGRDLVLALSRVRFAQADKALKDLKRLADMRPG